MSQQSTCWTLIRDAAAGNTVSANEFSLRYSNLVQAYLRKRWQGTGLITYVDDACQDVFFELFRNDGALVKLDKSGGRRFRSFLYGVVANIAKRAERKHANSPTMVGVQELLAIPDASHAVQFDRIWANSMVEQAVTGMRQRAQRMGDVAQRRVELLHLRFFEQMPIREIAAQWGMEASKVHKEYARARTDFRVVLTEVLAFHSPGSSSSLERELREIASLL